MPVPVPRRRAVLAVLAALLLAGPALPAAAAPPVPLADGPDVTWGVRAAGQDQSAERSTFDYTVRPGATATDGFTTSSGRLDVVTREVESVAVGAWVKLGTGHVTVPAAGSVEVPFTVRVPKDATPGDYAGGLVTSLPQPQVTDGIAVDRRLGVRLRLRVQGELEPGLTVDPMRVAYHGTVNPFGTGRATVTYTVRNTGNVRLAAGQAVSVAGPFGLGRRTAPVPDDVPELLPGESWDVVAEVSGVLPVFRLTASTTLDLEPADAGLPVEPWSVRATASTAAVPLAPLVLVVLVAAGIVAAVLLARKRARERRRGEEARVAEAVAQALRDRDGAGAPDPTAPVRTGAGE